MPVVLCHMSAVPWYSRCCTQQHSLAYRRHLTETQGVVAALCRSPAAWFMSQAPC
jgi:hypothetical protein